MTIYYGSQGMPEDLQRAPTRLELLGMAFSPRRIVKFLPCAIFFAGAATLQALAYSSGVSASLGTALGYVYMPIAALFSFWILGKYYMWIEWFALSILTLASSVFGFLQHVESGGAGKNSVLGIMFVIASACCSVFGSLTAEKALKAEALPFHIQKVRLDFGSILASAAIGLPIVGVISERPQDAFWKYRPLNASCDASCQKYIEKAKLKCYDAITDIPQPCTSCDIKECFLDCVCRWGVFVDWRQEWRLLAITLALNVIQGWLTGQVIKQFSTVLRAIAQSSTILVIYFIGSPLLQEDESHTYPLTLTACIVPLSTATFMLSVVEMQKVMEKGRAVYAPAPPDESCRSGGQLSIHSGSCRSVPVSS